ncbi:MULTISPECIES: hypothetical protein [unclassified Streptomyces]|uniref:hypothetical protein n=1 Tax=unclassified Streptomyces TaxID=2593676 RepID=UPI002365157E|nr:MULTISPECIES: hypothetical protein [unclassified Streptomyces]MDF3140939.1 hypothetical protein [Streptomyces sp. T21Q-yed]WDF43610.1 hypothetical protein PBV52_45950 [Streptomyces sp. T12]
MYGVNTLLMLGPAADLLLRRRSDHRIRPVVLAALGLTAAAGGFVLLRALHHRPPTRPFTRHDFLPPRPQAQHVHPEQDTPQLHHDHHVITSGP